MYIYTMCLGGLSVYLVPFSANIFTFLDFAVFNFKNIISEILFAFILSIWCLPSQSVFGFCEGF
jgi:hypothetical protein